MASLFLVRNDDPRFAQTALAEARAVLSEQGFPEPSELGLPGWTLLHAGHIIAGPPAILQRGDDLVAVAGTLVADGKMGDAALAALLDMDPLALDWDRLGGQFVALVRRNGRNFLFGDYFSAFQLFHDTDDRVFATAFLAAARALPRLSFDAQGVYELVFNVMPVGDDTVFEQLRTLSPNSVVELTATGTVRHSVAKPLPVVPSNDALPDRIARHRDRLLGIVGAHVDALGGNVRAPLSGGLDSRLVLAALRNRGCAPHVYVYGVPDDEDVVIARQIGDTLGFPIEWLDKEDGTVPPDAFADLVDRNYRQYDGLPTFGNIFDNGTNGTAQLARHADGALAVSGAVARSTAISSTSPTAASPRTISRRPSSRASPPPTPPTASTRAASSTPSPARSAHRSPRLMQPASSHATALSRSTPASAVAPCLVARSALRRGSAPISCPFSTIASWRRR
ncbi:hypothetical protein LRS12_13505 [Sphingomonas sp. J344]|uniref:hypothetical protein n=1 Tax=Sphingomonas sp. J344 TaxID=2898434 RepID=UPI0021516948|nr:hypothetical protein [Sphingomonas sp. J344]MCR5871646.1 hypothetical protein [Sphingomonas sp. J344]